MDFELLKKLSFFMKYGIFIATILMTGHVGTVLCGMNLHFAEWICGLSIMGFCMLMTASFILNYGNLFRCMLTYVFFVKQCILIQRLFKFSDNVAMPMLGILLVCGIALIVIFIINANKYRDENGENLDLDKYIK